MLTKLLKDAAILLATIDPLGTLTLYVALMQGREAAERRRVAGRAVLVGGGILLVFLILGQLVLSAMNVSLVSFQIAGALFLLVFGGQLTFGALHRSDDLQPEPGHDVAVFPLALPGIASPGAITAIVVLTDNTTYSIATQALTALVLAAVLVLTYGMLRAAEPVHRVLGRGGAAVVVRVLGLLLAALAVEMLVAALREAGILAS